MVDQGTPLTRDEKLENLIMNHSMIFMGMFEEAFSTLADRMTETLAKGTAAMAEALADGSAGSGNLNIEKKMKDEISPEVRSQIGHLFAGIREEIASQWPKNGSLFKQYVSAPDFDEGIKIVEKHDFGRPRLTEKLSDGELASYVFLLQSGDKELSGMFKELSDWQSTLPRPPWSP